MIRNNVTRLLTSHNIQFTAYELPKVKKGALETAQILNVSPEVVFKTIVIKRSGRQKPILAVIPATKETDLKSIASLYKNKEGFLTNTKRN